MQKVFDYIREHEMITAEDKVIVGVSGGADSVCLLFVLREYQRQLPFSMMVVHVEHGVRGEESRQDAAFVEALCKEWHIPCKVFASDVPAMARQQKISVEEAGRKVRYETFAQMGEEWGATKIAVAHNQNDQAETMIWNMVRGSGITGAGGIRPVRGKVIRPLLCCSRREIEECLRSQEISWREDCTNQEMEYTRNCIRQHILPQMEKELNAGAVEHLANLGKELQRTESYLCSVAEKAMANTARIEADRVEIDLEGLKKEDPLIQEHVIRMCLERVGCGLKDLGRIHMEQILELFAGQSGRKISLPGGWQAGKSFDRGYLEKRKEQPVVQGAEIPVPGEIETAQGILQARIFSHNHENIPQKKYTKWIDYDKIKNSLCLRTRQPGDYLVIDQKGSKKKLKVYFIEEKIPADRRDQILLVASGSEILWVVGYRMNDAYKVWDSTERVLELTMQGREE